MLGNILVKAQDCTTHTKIINLSIIKYHYIFNE